MSHVFTRGQNRYLAKEPCEGEKELGKERQRKEKTQRVLAVANTHGNLDGSLNRGRSLCHIMESPEKP